MKMEINNSCFRKMEKRKKINQSELQKIKIKRKNRQKKKEEEENG